MFGEPTEQVKCIIALQWQNVTIPVVGLNHTQGGYFLNYYLNKEYPWFGPEAHDSRHDSLIACRYSKTHDLWSLSEGVISIDKRNTPEELPCRSVTPNLFLEWRPVEKLKNLAREILMVSATKCEYGILARVTVWPSNQSPSAEEMERVWLDPPRNEPLVQVFRPKIFPNPVSIGVFSVDRLMLDLPFFIDGPLTSSSEGPVYSKPGILRGPRKGRD
jgi:hypothetical protein